MNATNETMMTDATNKTTMRVTRIEFDGAAGSVTIERKPDSATIRVDSILCNPKGGEQQAWKTWELNCHADKNEMLEVAACIQWRTDGQRGTDRMIRDYYRELERFTG